MKTKRSFIFAQMKGYRIKFALLFLFVLSSSIIGTFYPLFLGKMIDSVLYQQDFRMFFTNFVYFGAVFLSHQIVWFLHTRLEVKLRNTFLIRIKKRCLQKVLSYKSNSLDRMQSGDIIYRVEHDVNQIMNYLYVNIIYAISDVFELITQLIVIYIINWRLLVLTLITMPLSFFVSNYFAKRSKKHYKEVNNAQNTFNSWLFEIIDGLRDIKLLNARHRIMKILVKKRSHIIREDIKAKRNEIASSTGLSTVSFFVEMSLFICSSIFIMAGTLTIGGFISTIEYFNSSLSCFNDIFGRANPITQNLVSIDRVMEIFDKESEKTQATDELDGKKPIYGNIRFNNVTFAYDTQQVLKNVSFQINPGEKVAIVGHSGSGKSTLISLLIRLYDTQNGNIYLDDCDIRTYATHYLRNHIGVVHQNNVLFQGTIRFNLQFSDDTNNDEQIWKALEYAKMKEFVMSLPKKLDTWIGASGIEVSGGQRQRFTIARLYLRNPSVIIFDEATSSLDSNTEKSILKCIGQVYANKTTLTIAHKLSTVINSDKVLFMNNGKVEAFGKHHHLLQTNTMYSQFFSSQTVKDGDRI